MSFITALASCWDILKCRASSVLVMLNNSPLNLNLPLLFHSAAADISGFYESYELEQEYSLNNLPPKPYQNKYTIQQIRFDANNQRSYRIKVGLTTVVDKLVDSFLGLPFAILEVLANLLLLTFMALTLVEIFYKFPDFLLINPSEALKSLGLLVMFTVIFLCASIINLMYIILKTLLKIPLGIFIGIEALIKLTLSYPIDPPTIQEINKLDIFQIKQQGIAYQLVNNEFEIALKTAKININKIDLPARYYCPITAIIIKPVLLSDGYIYDEDTAKKILNDPKKFSPFNNKPLANSRISLNSYEAETQAFVEALIAENKTVNYNSTITTAKHHTELAEQLHEILMDKFNTKNTLIHLEHVTVLGQQLNISTTTIQIALDILKPIIGKYSVSEHKLANEAIQAFFNIKNSSQYSKRLFVTALTEAMLAEQNLVNKFAFQVMDVEGSVSYRPIVMGTFDVTSNSNAFSQLFATGNNSSATNFSAPQYTGASL